MSEIDAFIDLTRSIFQSKGFIGLHEPRFKGNESKYILETINSTFVSSVGKYVDSFEESLATYTGVPKAVAVVNGTAALHVSLNLAGVTADTEVITQALTFVATANAISYNNAVPVFLDVDSDSMGLSPLSLTRFLETYGDIREEGTFNKASNKRISAIVPMHTLGFIGKIDEIVAIASKWNIPVVEDAAEALGSRFAGKHAGTFGQTSALSFNGNKLITSGGGGAILSMDENYAEKAKHLTTTAKQPHSWEYRHDEIGYNYRMPNLNAALALAQLEQVQEFIASKKTVFSAYEEELSSTFQLKKPPQDMQWNYWLFPLEFDNRKDRDFFLEQTNRNGVMTRPIWQLMFQLPMYKDCYRDDQSNALILADTIVNIPSSARG